MTKAIFASVEVDMTNLPNGEYKGVWGGYNVSVVIAGSKYFLKTDNGIRTPSADCLVHVCDGKVTVELSNGG